MHRWPAIRIPVLEMARQTLILQTGVISKGLNLEDKAGQGGLCSGESRDGQ